VRNIASCFVRTTPTPGFLELGYKIGLLPERNYRSCKPNSTRSMRIDPAPNGPARLPKLWLNCFVAPKLLIATFQSKRRLVREIIQQPRSSPNTRLYRPPSSPKIEKFKVWKINRSRLRSITRLSLACEMKRAKKLTTSERDVGQASRISGVSRCRHRILTVWLKRAAVGNGGATSVVEAEALDPDDLPADPAGLRITTRQFASEGAVPAAINHCSA